MSKKDKDDDTVLPEDETSVAEEAATEEVVLETEPQPEVAPAPRVAVARPNRSAAWLALPVSLVALVSVAYLLVDNWRAQRGIEQSADSVADIRNRVATSTDALTDIDAALAELETADAGLASQLEFLQQDIENRLQLLDSLPPRVSNLEASISTLQGVSTGARNTWLLAEAEYYMQIANAQLQLAGNPHLAALALGMADERVLQLADPAFTDVRRAISDELAALEGMEKPDVEGVTLTLASLARVVESLPLRQVVMTEAEASEQPDPNQGGIDRAWASVKGAVSGLVRISGPDEGTRPLLAPEAEYFLRTNLALQLQAARLSLLRGEQAVFEQSLDDAATWLDEYFDADSAQVASSLQTIGEIRSQVVTTAKPDISASLRLLRQAKTLTEPAQ